MDCNVINSTVIEFHLSNTSRSRRARTWIARLVDRDATDCAISPPHNELEAEFMDTVKIISDKKGRLHIIPNNLYRTMLGTGHIQTASNLKLLTKANLPITLIQTLNI